MADDISTNLSEQRALLGDIRQLLQTLPADFARAAAEQTGNPFRPQRASSGAAAGGIEDAEYRIVDRRGPGNAQSEEDEAKIGRRAFDARAGAFENLGFALGRFVPVFGELAAFSGNIRNLFRAFEGIRDVKEPGSPDQVGRAREVGEASGFPRKKQVVPAELAPEDAEFRVVPPVPKLPPGQQRLPPGEPPALPSYPRPGLPPAPPEAAAVPRLPYYPPGEKTAPEPPTLPPLGKPWEGWRDYQPLPPLKPFAPAAFPEATPPPKVSRSIEEALAASGTGGPLVPPAPGGPVTAGEGTQELTGLQKEAVELLRQMLRVQQDLLKKEQGDETEYGEQETPRTLQPAAIAGEGQGSKGGPSKEAPGPPKQSGDNPSLLQRVGGAVAHVILAKLTGGLVK